MIAQTTKRLVFLAGSLLACSPGIALADNDTRVVDCSRGDSIQRAIDDRNPDKPLTLLIRRTT